MATLRVERQRQANQVFDIIAEEVRVSRSELGEVSDFAELGVDDLLARTISTRIMETLSLELPQAALKDHPNVEDLQAYIHNTAEQTVKPVIRPSTGASATPASTSTLTAKPAGPLSILLQGKPTSAKQTIFLLPDGSGSGMAYARLPRISPSICLIGMNSPFLHTAGAFTSTIEALAPIWVQEIRQRQPCGPYILGGWSAGGYYSFEVAKQLMREGERVEKLILIDSPCRLKFEPLPMEVIRFLAAKNLLGNWGAKKAPEWFVNHFTTTIEAVAKYVPKPMDPKGQLPQVYIVWPSGGVLEDIDAAETGLDLTVKITRFLLEDRKDFGLHGWDMLFPGATVSIATMPGNHFTIVHPPHVSPC